MWTEERGEGKIIITSKKKENGGERPKKGERESRGVSWGGGGGVCVLGGEVGGVGWITMAGVQSWLIVSDTLQFLRLISTLFLQL